MAVEKQQEQQKQERIGEMTRNDLTMFVIDVVRRDQRDHPYHPYQQKGDQPVREILKAMREEVWTPPPGAKSSLELLREDRDR
jgi:hypothetical protein